MIYTIEWSERKTTSTGKPKIDATLKGADGVMHEHVTIWGDFPGFAELMTRNSVEGEIVEKQNGQYTNKTLYAPKVQKQSNGSFKSHQIKETMAEKREDITRFQNNKEHSVKVASTFRAATETALIEWQDQRRTSPMTAQPIEKLVEKWREHYWMMYDVKEDQYPPFQ